MKLTQIKIKDLFGIREIELTGKDLETCGANATGKTSIIDAIKFALTNRSDRQYIIRKGEAEGEIYIETDAGIQIDRKKRQEKADYISVKENGKSVTTKVESFISELFTPLQLDPVAFIEMTTEEQNRILLDLIQFKWDLNWIQEQFGEIVPGINYEQNILRVLHDIQDEKGYYFQKRQEFNRQARNYLAFIADIGSTLPPEYQASKWREYDLQKIYSEIEKISAENLAIEQAKTQLQKIETAKLENLQKRDTQLADINSSSVMQEKNIRNAISELEKQLIVLREDLLIVDAQKSSLEKYTHEKCDNEIARLNAERDKIAPLAAKPATDTTQLAEQANFATDMIKFLREYDRMVGLQQEVEVLKTGSEILTKKIDKARALPGEILANCQIPVAGLTIENGEPRINGLPVSNLSEGEKLNLCIDVAKSKLSALNLILIDGIEKLSDKNRYALYARCKENNVQFIATRTDNADELKIIEI